MDTWVLAGQSNMQGLAPLGDLRRTVAADDRVEHLSSAGEWEIAIDPLRPLWESYTPVKQLLMRAELNPDHGGIGDHELAGRERTLGVFGAGLGPSFGAELAELSGSKVGLVPAAHDFA